MRKMIRCVSVILGLSLAAGVCAHGQELPAREFSEAEKTGIVESVLKLERRKQDLTLRFDDTQRVSSENIEFIEPSRVTRQGFTLVPARQLSGWHLNQIVEYLVFRNIISRDLRSAYHR